MGCVQPIRWLSGEAIMNTSDKKYQTETEATVPEASLSDTSQTNSRRKLLKKAGLLAVPLVTTLASRPVLAWHCRTPSMWGSMAMNPATSLMKNNDHLTGVLDESWYIINWADNSSRSNIGKPWDKLFNTSCPSRPGIFSKTNPNTGTVITFTTSSKTRYLRTDLYNVADLCTDAGIVCNASGTVASLFSGSNVNGFNAHIVVAQLNEKLLTGVRSCVGAQIDLAAVAQSNGYVTINGVNWTPQMFIDYFEANWIAVANSTSQSLWSSGPLVDNPGDKTQVISQKIYETPTVSGDQERHYFTFK